MIIIYFYDFIKNKNKFILSINPYDMAHIIKKTEPQWQDFIYSRGIHVGTMPDVPHWYHKDTTDKKHELCVL